MNAVKSKQPSRTRSRTVVSTLVWTTAVGMLSMAAIRPDEDGPDIEGTRNALEQWVEIRRTISKEQRDWTLGRELLANRTEIVEREIEAMRARTREAEASMAEAEAKRADLAAERDQSTEALGGLQADLASLERRTKELLTRLPDPIRERVLPLSQSIPDDPEATNLTVSRRVQNVVGILNEVDKFQREITVTSEVRALPDGSSAEVSVMYVGLGQAYYVDRNARIAGVGTGAADKWTWSPANDAAPEIARALSILKNEEVADFVRLPILIQ